MSRKSLKRRLRRAGLLKASLIPKGVQKKRKWKRIDKRVFAAKLNLDLPDSEKWFWREWQMAGMQHGDDKPNEVFCGYIPDVVNHRYRYVIEVDGGVHLRPSVQKKDVLKEKAFAKKGYAVFRLEAYSYEKFGILTDEIEKLRADFDRKEIAASKPKTILRKCVNNTCL